MRTELQFRKRKVLEAVGVGWLGQRKCRERLPRVLEDGGNGITLLCVCCNEECREGKKREKKEEEEEAP